MTPGEHGVPCSDCGATDCEALFHACLVADYSDPAFGAVHHLVVPTYGLQHGWYRTETQPAVAEFILGHLDRAPNEHDLRLIRAATDGSTQVRARQPSTQNADWDHHIGNVDLHRPDTYTATVRRWAESVATTLLGNEPMATGDGTPSR